MMKSRFTICLMMLAMFAVMASAKTISITIVDGVSGSDGQSVVGSGGAPDTTADSMTMGWASWGWQSTAQTYYKIPDELKVPGVTIVSATLQMLTKYCNDGAPVDDRTNTVDGYGGMYFQLMHYTYDTGTVSIANGNATTNSANYTKVGSPHFQIATDNSWHSWDVTSNLQSDITAGWTYSPYVTRLTYSNGTLCESPFGPEGYYGQFWSSNAINHEYLEPKIVIEYLEPCITSIGMLRGVNGDTVSKYGDDPYAPGHIIINGNNATAMGNVNALEFVADMQFVQDIAALGVQNRAVATDINPRTTKIYVAPDESAVGFDPQDANSFTQQINVFAPYAVNFEPDKTDANLTRWINVTPVSRRYVKFEITEIDRGPIGATYSLAQWQDVLSSATLQGLPSAGSIKGLGEDEIGFGQHGGYDYMTFFEYYDETAVGFTADAVIDLTSVKDIQKIRNINGKAEDTLYNINNVKIYVTPASGAGSENEAGFDPLDKANYTVEIFNGSFYPSSYLAGVERVADVTDVSRRYIMLEISSNYWGNFGEEIAGPGYNYYAVNADFEVIGTDSITKCSDVIALGLALPGDLNADCQINMSDVKLMTDEWLKCTTPGETGCIEYTNHPTFQIAKGSGITINGNLGDWPSDSEWIWLDEVYSGIPPFDISDARMSLRWGDDNRIYVAVVVTDSNHTFIDVPDSNYADSDRIEIYSQGDAAGGTDWGAGGTKFFNVAQQYMVGLKTLLTGGRWAVWGDLTNVDPNALESAVVVNGNQIIYEAAVKQYDNYGGKGGGATVVTSLGVGTAVGFDVTVGTRYSNNTAYGMLAENDFTGKYNDADQFRLYELVLNVRAKTCGDWGYTEADFVPDCIVNFADFAAFAEKWMQCNDPADEENCVHNW